MGKAKRLFKKGRKMAYDPTIDGSTTMAQRDQMAGDTKIKFGKEHDEEITVLEGKAQKYTGKAEEASEPLDPPKHYVPVTDESKSGTKDILVGKIKKNIGKMTHKDKMKYEGKAQEAHGKAQKLAHEEGLDDKEYREDNVY